MIQQVKHLKQLEELGMEREKAEKSLKLIEQIIHSESATKHDLLELELRLNSSIDKLKDDFSYLKDNFSGLKDNFSDLKDDFNDKINNLRSDVNSKIESSNKYVTILVITMITIQVAIIGILIAKLF